MMDVDTDASMAQDDPQKALVGEGSCGHTTGDMPAGRDDMNVDETGESGHSKSREN